MAVSPASRWYRILVIRPPAANWTRKPCSQAPPREALGAPLTLIDWSAPYPVVETRVGTGEVTPPAPWALMMNHRTPPPARVGMVAV